ncbi:hypothetical protein I6A84_43460 [Frankia sp. CNm7]|uniref:Calcium-binding protein n=1 Tax=Frankia nepalensis TaxID=1836974 RepID=A0A937UJE3_9ACTN|nr:hypothetical protein [Frankia nepalensis]MBL7499591.1 hypothetical protein [Frankia nepalensis]MBL7514217.1 hypothetical protein [Frankia nepalensis]MBL7524723.1 hypothetical protein [Frankia nepalensis]MBL7625709.1 hypothetical protein [Frankia nepalensis]
MSRPRVAKRIRALAIAAASLLGAGIILGIAPPASAARTQMTIWYFSSYPDISINYYTSEGADEVSVEIPAGDQNRIVFHDPNASSMTIRADVPGTPCTLDNPTTISCVKQAPDSNSPPNWRKVEHVSIIGWDGDDTFSASGFGMVYGQSYKPIGVTLSGWEGADILTASGGKSSLVAGDGDDRLTSGPGSANTRDSVDGGNGNDVIEASTNSADLDSIYCRAGTDSVTKNSADIIYDSPNCETVIVV